MEDESGFHNERIRNIGIDLVKSMDSIDFIGVFATLEDYEIKNLGNNLCVECLESFEKDWDYSPSSYRISAESSCNCKWTCGGKLGPNVTCTTSDCKETRAGCGFFWTQSCKKRDVIVDAGGEC